MGDFAWRSLVKQVGPTGRTVPLSEVVATTEEKGQLAGEVGPITIVV